MPNCINSCLILSVVLFLTACGTSSNETKVGISPADTIRTELAKSASDKSVHIDEVNSTFDTENETETYYVVVADSNTNYYSLRGKMLALHKSLKNPIDTMGRYYNEAKNLIALPDDDEDEIYRGDYFPRRFPSNALSLEYLKFYKESSEEKTIALIAGIYESKHMADSALTNLKKYNNNAFTVKADIFVGCMH